MDKSIYNVGSIIATKKRKKKNLAKMFMKGIEPEYRAGVMKSEFYLTREWKQLRWEVLVASDGKCCMCGRSKADGVILHVDHIRPRSKFPVLELRKDNLQVLCSDCNLGKGTKTWGQPKHPATGTLGEGVIPAPDQSALTPTSTQPLTDRPKRRVVRPSS